MDPEDPKEETIKVGPEKKIFPEWLEGEFKQGHPDPVTQEIPKIVPVKIESIITPQNPRNYFGLILFIAFMAFVCGYSLTPRHDNTRTIIERPPATATAPAIATPAPAIATPAPTVTVEAMPESCQAALSYQTQLAPFVKTIIDSSGPVQDALQDGYVAIGDRDVKGINDAVSKLHELDDQLSVPEQEYLTLLQDSVSATKSCLAQIPQ
jgi:hypothetical protein